MWSRKKPACPAGRTWVIHMADGLSRKERRGPPVLSCFISHAFSWFLLFTHILCSTALWDRNATRGEEPGPLHLCWEGWHMCGSQDTQDGTESSSAMLSDVRCVINFHNRVENPGNVVGMQSFLLDLFFLYMLLF